MAPHNLTEALAIARLEKDPTDSAAKQIVEAIIERNEEHRFRTTAYHAAPKTEMY